MDTDGNVYTAEVDNAKRAQKFRKVRWRKQAYR